MNLPRRLWRRNPFPQTAQAQSTSSTSTKSPATCGPQCIMLVAGSAAGVLLAVLLVLGVLIYRRRKAQDEEDDMLAEMEDDWRFQPRLSVSGQGAGTGRKFSSRSSRKPSMAQAMSAGGGAAPWSAGGGGYGPSYGGANPSMLGPRGSRPSLTVGLGGAGGGGGLDLPRRPSRADLSQMDVYRKMSVIGIV